MPNDSAPETDEPCPFCLKPRTLCVCAEIVPVANRIALLILQHPQEQDKTLGTARLAVRQLGDATLRVGLSWPSLANALGRPADPQRWAVLYLGSAKAATLLPDREVVAINGKGAPVPDQAAAFRAIEGIIVLDGTWSQAKTLWWRNPWVLKCQRVILGPQRPSRYGKLRYEPRGDSLSTLEAAALLLRHLEDRPEIETALVSTFERLLGRYRLMLADPAVGVPAEHPAKRPDWRARSRGRRLRALPHR
ncbi:MAG: DTW domain-containing protein [Azospirillaceae bacterium]|nr:DTW domain-containing protein [Azospirillaceae bacterium]